MRKQALKGGQRELPSPTQIPEGGLQDRSHETQQWAEKSILRQCVATAGDLKMDETPRTEGGNGRGVDGLPW